MAPYGTVVRRNQRRNFMVRPDDGGKEVVLLRSSGQKNLEGKRVKFRNVRYPRGYPVGITANYEVLPETSPNLYKTPGCEISLSEKLVLMPLKKISSERSSPMDLYVAASQSLSGLIQERYNMNIIIMNNDDKNNAINLARCLFDDYGVRSDLFLAIKPTDPWHMSHLGSIEDIIKKREISREDVNALNICDPTIIYDFVTKDTRKLELTLNLMEKEAGFNPGYWANHLVLEQSWGIIRDLKLINDDEIIFVALPLRDIYSSFKGKGDKSYSELFRKMKLEVVG